MQIEHRKMQEKRKDILLFDQKRKAEIYSFGRESEEVYYACHHKISNSCQYAVSKEGHNNKISLLIVLKDFYMSFCWKFIHNISTYHM